MRIIPADAALLGEGFGGASRGAGILIAKGNVVVGEVADRLYQPPARWKVAKGGPGRGHHLVGIAVPATQQVEQLFIWKVLNRMLWRVEGNDIWLPPVAQGQAACHGQPAGRCDNA